MIPAANTSQVLRWCAGNLALTAHPDILTGSPVSVSFQDYWNQTLEKLAQTPIDNGFIGAGVDAFTIHRGGSSEAETGALRVRVERTKPIDVLMGEVTPEHHPQRPSVKLRLNQAGQLKLFVEALTLFPEFGEQIGKLNIEFFPQAMEGVEGVLGGEFPFLSGLVSLHIGLLNFFRFGEDYWLIPRALAANPHFRSLRTLALGGGVDAEGIDCLLGAAHLRGLLSLTLRNGRFGDEGARLLAESSNFPDLRHLFLQSNDIGPQGAKALAGSRAWPSLKTLHLIEDELGPEFAEILASNAAFANLQSLNILFKKGDDERVRLLLRSTALASLRTLIVGTKWMEPDVRLEFEIWSQNRNHQMWRLNPAECPLNLALEEGEILPLPKDQMKYPHYGAVNGEFRRKLGGKAPIDFLIRRLDSEEAIDAWSVTLATDPSKADLTDIWLLYSLSGGINDIERCGRSFVMLAWYASRAGKAVNEAAHEEARQLYSLQIHSGNKVTDDTLSLAVALAKRRGASSEAEALELIRRDLAQAAGDFRVLAP